MPLQSPHISTLSVVHTPKKPTENNILSTVERLVKEEKIKINALALLQQAEELVVQADFPNRSLGYKHRLITQGKGYALREKRTLTLHEHLRAVLSELSPINQKTEYQWILSICQGVLSTQTPERLALVLLEQTLRLNNKALPKTKKRLISFSQWLKRQTVAYQHTWEGQRLAVIIELLQFKST